MTWTPEEDTLLSDMTPHFTLQQVALVLNRTEEDITQRAAGKQLPINDEQQHFVTITQLNH